MNMGLIQPGSKINTFDRPKCYLCGEPGRVFHSKLGDFFCGTSGEWGSKKCSNPNCGLIWLSPAPLKEEIGKAYEKYYTHESENSIGANSKSFAKRILVFMYLVFSKFVSFTAGLSFHQKKMAGMFLDGIEPQRLLDIGCGDGSLLARMQKRGWRVEGVDFDIKAVKNVQNKYGIPVGHGSIEEMGYASNTFDAITMRHVIEHVFDPVKTIQEVLRILKPGGRLIVIAPNVQSMGSKLLGQDWLGVDPPRHLFLFSIETLHQVMKDAGFKKLKTFSSAATAEEMIRGSLYYRERRLSASDQSFKKKGPVYIWTLSWILGLYEYFSLLWNKSAGDEVVSIGEK